MNTLLERIDWILINRWKGNASEMARASGLARQHVTTLRGRLAKDPAADIELGTLRRLADAAGVPMEWLARGVGTPDGVPAVPTRRDDIYPNRALVVAEARSRGVEERALELLAEDRNAEGDRSVEDWTARLLEIRRGLRYVARALEADIDDSALDHVPGASMRRAK